MNIKICILLLAAGLSLGGCSSGLGAYAYCIAVDHDINKRCQ